MKNTLYLGLIAIESILLFACTKHSQLIINSDWIVVSMESNNQPYMEAEYDYELIFEDGKNFRVILDVNTCGGTYRFSRKDRVTFSTMACTEACCDSYFAERIVEYLSKIETYILAGDTLTLHGDDGLKMVLVKK